MYQNEKELSKLFNGSGVILMDSGVNKVSEEFLLLNSSCYLSITVTPLTASRELNRLIMGRLVTTLSVSISHYQQLQDIQLFLDTHTQPHTHLKLTALWFLLLLVTLRDLHCLLDALFFFFN